MKTAAFVFALAASAFALPAAAQMDMSTSNLYVGATFGQSKFGDACEGASGSCDDKDTAWRALVGYQFSPMFSAEVGYHNLGSISDSSGSADAKLWELVGIAAFPIQQFNIYGKLGGYRAKFEGGGTDDSSTGWTAGIGAGFEPMRNLGLRLEWQRYNSVGSGDGIDVDVISIGALWRFR
jgi:OmpA-OmpF porin, OOP family